MGCKRMPCDHSAFYEIRVNGEWVCAWCQSVENERVRAELAAEENMRHYVSFVLTGRNDSDVQLAVDENVKRLARCQALLREACEPGPAINWVDWIRRAKEELGDERTTIRR